MSSRSLVFAASLGALLTVAAPAFAQSGESTGVGARTRAAPPQGGGAGAPARSPFADQALARRRPPPNNGLTPARLRATALRMRPVLARCLQRAHPDREFRIRMRLRMLPRPTPRLELRTVVMGDGAQSSAYTGCIEQFRRRIERRLVRMNPNRPVQVMAQLRVNPRVTAPPPPPPEATQSVRARVDATLGRVASRLRGCFAGATGDATFQVEVRPDGSLAMVGASLPPGHGNPQTLSCAAEAIGSVRVIAPPAEVRRVEHRLSLR